MSFKNIEQLKRALVRSRLLSPAQVDEGSEGLAPRENNPNALLKQLEAKQLLTSYQVSRLEKGNADGLVLGDFKLMYRNASGSFARVFRACSLKDGSMVGLKVLRQRWAADPQMVSQFHREAELCKKLVHPNIVPIYDVGSQGDFHYFTMEFVEGGNLRDFLRIRNKVSPEEAGKSVLEMARGLAFALRLGVTHRDLKLTNVLMSTDLVAKLVDFGLAGNEEISGTTSSGGGAGDGVQRALEYATIEDGTSAPKHDPRSDLFFLGAIFYELLTGVPPWKPTSNREERRMLSRYSNVRPIRAIDPNVPRPIEEIVERLLVLNPTTRYQTPNEAASDLEKVLTEMGVDAGSPNAKPPEPVQRAAPKETNSQPRVLCIERRMKQQDVLREYLTKHGFRVLMLSDMQRALQRCQNDPPECLLLIGDSVGDQLINGLKQAKELQRHHPIVVVTVVSELQDELKPKIEEYVDDLCRVLMQPIKLRDVRREIHLGMRAKRKR